MNFYISEPKGRATLGFLVVTDAESDEGILIGLARAYCPDLGLIVVDRRREATAAGSVARAPRWASLRDCHGRGFLEGKWDSSQTTNDSWPR